jgi:hypothetical protein
MGIYLIFVLFMTKPIVLQEKEMINNGSAAKITSTCHKYMHTST